MFLRSSKIHWKDLRLGFVGRGRVGSRLIDFFIQNQFMVSYYDPFLNEPGSLEAVVSADLVSFHVPLTRQGEHATFEMIDNNYFQGKLPAIINSSRGKIWAPGTYESMAKSNRLFCQDVYPVEPPIDTMVTSSEFATPHIAGYSTRGRLDGISKVVSRLFEGIILKPYPESVAWWLEDESARFKRDPANFQSRRDTFPFRKQFSELSEDEVSNFFE